MYRQMTDSEMYECMVYVMVAELHFHRACLRDTASTSVTLGQFAKRNASTIEVIVADIRRRFKYEVIHQQIEAAVAGYLAQSHRLLGGVVPS